MASDQHEPIIASLQQEIWRLLILMLPFVDAGDAIKAAESVGGLMA
jgi:hypothetical protein